MIFWRFCAEYKCVDLLFEMHHETIRYKIVSHFLPQEVPFQRYVHRIIIVLTP